MAQNVTTEVKALNDDEFQIVRTNSDGKVKDAQVYKASMALDDATLGKVLMDADKREGTLRAARQTLLGRIFANKRLDGFIGKGDTATGKVAAEFKAAIRDAETNTIEEMVKSGTIRLPKADDVQVELQAYLKRLRDDKNYSNIKSYCTQYAAFCGKMPVTGSGRLVPQPVMAEQIKAAIHRIPTDKGFAAQLQSIAESLEKATIGIEDARKSLDVVTMMQVTLRGIVADADAQATADHANAAHVATNALRDAAKGPQAGKAHRAPAAAREPIAA